MKAEFLTQFPLSWLTSLGLVIFFTIYIMRFFSVFLKTNEKKYKAAEVLPLNDKENSHE